MFERFKKKQVNKSSGSNNTVSIIVDNSVYESETLGYENARYKKNPILSSVINLRANYLSNGKIYVRNIKTGDIIKPEHTEIRKTDYIVKQMFRLLDSPNPTQSWKEFMTQWSILRDIYGNSMIYGNHVREINIKNIDTLWNLNPYCVKPIIYDNYMFAPSSLGVIKEWEYNSRPIASESVLHMKEPNTDFLVPEDMILGKSKISYIEKPLSNIEVALESLAKIARERGMRAILSSDKKDGFMGTVALEEEEKLQIYRDLARKFGFRDDQNQFFLSGEPIKVTTIDQDVTKFGLFELVSTSGIIVYHAYGIPEVLLKLYLEGATFENQESSEKRAYQNTIIPLGEDMIKNLNDWLKVKQFGYEYVIDFSHLPVLQQNYKDRAIADKNVTVSESKLFFSGGSTYNDWLKALGKELIDEPWAKLRITEMSERDILIVTGNFNLNKNSNV